MAPVWRVRGVLNGRSNRGEGKLIRRLILAAVVAVALVSATSAVAFRRHVVSHRRGCNTEACDRRIDVRWAVDHPPPMQEALASWFEDAGATACGTHYALGFAHVAGIPCGARVEFCAVRCVIGVREDSGPYVAGREFDLNPGLKAALGCSDLCRVRWRRPWCCAAAEPIPRFRLECAFGATPGDVLAVYTTQRGRENSATGSLKNPCRAPGVYWRL